MRTILIIDKSGNFTPLTVKKYCPDELYKKCGFKKNDGFSLHSEWTIKLDKKKYMIQMHGKTNGKANTENKYEFPPPIDNTLFFGSCALVGFVKNETEYDAFNLTIEFWNKAYEKLFGGFEDLTTTAIEDEYEEDELERIPCSMKTKTGYLKDGFVVDSSDNENDQDTESENDDYKNEDYKNKNKDKEIFLDDICSELSEESYS
jgi:hypothetical protein